MTQVPTTTIDSPDQRSLRALMRRLAELESPEAAILSIYLDIRPEAHGERPGRRVELVVMRDRLRDITATYPAHDPARVSLDADVERIERFLEDEPLDGVEALPSSPATPRASGRPSRRQSPSRLRWAPVPPPTCSSWHSCSRRARPP